MPEQTMTPHALQLRHRFLVAMGLGSMTLGLLQACETAEDPSTDAAGTSPIVPPRPVDADGDGFAADQDCDDSSAAVNAQAEEICDGIDNNCDDVIDTDATDRIWKSVGIDELDTAEVQARLSDPAGTRWEPARALRVDALPADVRRDDQLQFA